MKLYAFNRDGTVTTSAGPVPIELVKKLKEQGHIVVAIGNQALCNEANIESGALGSNKIEHLQKLREKYPNCDAYIVVDNDHIIAKGWTYCTPQSFMEAKP